MTQSNAPASRPGQEPPRRPDRTFMSGPIALAVWETAVTENGHTHIQSSMRLEKRIFDEGRKSFRSTSTLFPRDLEHVRRVVEGAGQSIYLTEQTNSPASPAAPSAVSAAAANETPAGDGSSDAEVPL
jgi:hypothetical protein